MSHDHTTMIEDRLSPQSDSPSPGRSFAPGWRLSGLDIAVLAATAAGSAALWSTSPLLAIGLGFVVAHFFLFCNLFRIRRPAELLWAAVFTGLAAATILSGLPDWLATFGLSSLLTVGLLTVEMRHPSYHGIFWRQVNPSLPSYWAEQQRP